MDKMLNQAAKTNKDNNQYAPSKSYSFLILPIFIVLLGTLLGLWLEHDNRQLNQQKVQQALHSRLDKIANQVVEKITLYQYGLRGLRGAILSQNPGEFDYQHMLNYTNSRDYASEFPGARGFGFINRVTPDQKDDFVERMQQERHRPFQIKQLSPHEGDLFIIQYVEPEERNFEAIGLDISSEKNRREAALRAARDNTLSLTGPITLVQETQKTQHGFLLLMPVYQGAIANDPQQRLQQLVGWSYAPLLIGEILDSIEQINEHVWLTITDTSDDNTVTTFFTREAEQAKLPKFNISKDLSIYGRHWQLNIIATQSFIDSLAIHDAHNNLQLAVLLSLLLALIVFFIQLDWRRHRVVVRQQAELAAIVTNANEVIIGKNKQGIVTSWNEAAEQMFGYTEQEAVGRKIIDLIIPADKIDEEKYIISKIVSGEKIRSLDTTRQTKTGEIIPVSVNVTAIKDDNQQVIGSAVTMLDISHIKLAEQNLLRANEELEYQVQVRTKEIADVSILQRSILDNAGYAIIATDPKGVITLFNPAAEKILEYSQDEVVGKQTPAIFHDPNEIAARAKQLSAELNQTIEPGFEVFVAKAKLGKVDSREWSYIRKDGSVCQVNLSVNALKDSQGELVGFVGIAIDLTRQKQLEFELDLAKLSTEQTSDAVFWVTPEARILKVNQAACKALGYSNLILQRKVIEDVCPDYTKTKWSQHLQQLQANQELMINTEFLNNNAQTIPVSLTSTLVHLSGQKFIYMVARDISEQLAREKELAIAKDNADAANQAKSSFLANMSHEIRTPMNAILGLLQLIKQTDLTARQLDYINKTHNASKSLLSLLNDILDISKVEAGKMQLEEHPFDLHEFMHDINVILSANLAHKNIEVVYDIPVQNPLALIGDSLRLKQVMLNLAGNAIKFTEQGQVIITIDVMSQANDAIQLRFSIQDTGIGMTEQQLAQIFTSFNQAESSTSRRFGGTGLGLSISKRLVELMGGEISVESEIDKGSTFSFSIWLTTTEAPVKALTTADLPPNLDLLIVDDNEQARMILADIVQSQGWQADIAGSGLEALKMVENKQAANQHYDLIFMDWQMPDLDGWRTAERIRQMQNKESTSLIIMITAYSRELLAQKHLADTHLFNGFLEKPVTESTILSAINDTLTGKQIHNQEVQPHTSNQHKLTGLHILLVEDNPTNQLVASELLSNEGATVTIAAGGTFALTELENTSAPFDLILMDIQMPDLDGYQTTQRIRQMSDFKLIPIIAMTANAMQSDKEACFAAGMNDYVGKPFEINHLVNVILNNLNIDNPITETSPNTTDQSQPPITDNLLEFCQLENIDITVALERLGHSLSLYNKILESFSQDLNDYQVQLNGMDLLNEREMIVRIFHTLKGSSATVGMREMTAFATEQDTKLKQTDYHIDSQTLKQFNQLSWQTQQKVKQLQKQLVTATHNKVTAITPSSRSTKSLSQELDRLISSLAESNMQSLDIFSELQPDLYQLDANICNNIDNALNKLDFPTAIQQVERLRGKL
ncbi:PAS domain S-box protein [Neptunicella sp.]|uniref:CHASE domain-containing hybrid sensor histidine kinase/response regulator n=1 Tax=Neptunicella sp. TaxID=2125986 RepID=UPI003F694A27